MGVRELNTSFIKEEMEENNHLDLHAIKVELDVLVSVRFCIYVSTNLFCVNILCTISKTKSLHLNEFSQPYDFKMDLKPSDEQIHLAYIEATNTLIRFFYDVCTCILNALQT